MGQPSIIGVIGEFGTGKTLYATFMGIDFLANNPDKNLYTNFPLKNLGEMGKRWKQFSFKDISQNVLPEDIINGLMIIDEIQEGADAYDFMQSEVRNKFRFINQIRKNDLDLILCTPRITFIAYRIRQVLTHIVWMNEMFQDGHIKADWYKQLNLPNGQLKHMPMGTVEKDLSPYFQFYNTKYKVVKEAPEEKPKPEATEKVMLGKPKTPKKKKD